MKKVILLAALFSINAIAYEITGKVIHVADGDTITILDNGYMKHKIRLADIDAPEKGQPWGRKASKATTALTYGKIATADCREQDQYGRDVCTVTVNGIDVNKTLVAQGNVWVYTKYNRRADLLPLEAQAKSQQLGLWSLPEAQIINPADWRHGAKAIQKQLRERKRQQRSNASYSCGSKRYCGQMSSCEEAYFYLNQCGLSRLDRDHDGVPCEKICK